MIWRRLLQAIYPQHCPFCGVIIPRAQITCQTCADSLPYVDARLCPVCSKRPCICQEHHFCLDGTAPVFFYTGSVCRAILHFKKHGKRYYADVFAAYMAKAVAEKFSGLQFDLLIPVPMHPADRFLRGYAHMDALAKSLSSRTGIALSNHTVRKIKRTKKQQSLSAHERFYNLQQAFQCSKPQRIKGKTILVCDDVLTTGATVNELARLLKQSGAAGVYVVVLATTQHPSYPKRVVSSAGKRGENGQF